MSNRDFKNMSNGDIKIEMKNLENKYESIKMKVLKMILMILNWIPARCIMPRIHTQLIAKGRRVHMIRQKQE